MRKLAAAVFAACASTGIACGAAPDPGPRPPTPDVRPGDPRPHNVHNVRFRAEWHLNRGDLGRTIEANWSTGTEPGEHKRERARSGEWERVVLDVPEGRLALLHVSQLDQLKNPHGVTLTCVIEVDGQLAAYQTREESEPCGISVTVD